MLGCKEKFLKDNKVLKRICIILSLVICRSAINLSSVSSASTEAGEKRFSSFIYGVSSFSLMREMCEGILNKVLKRMNAVMNDL